MMRQFVRTWVRDGRAVEETVSLGGAIREAREEAGLAMRELARRSSVSAGQISRIEAGEVEQPSQATLSALATALGRSPIPLLYLAGHLDDEEMRLQLERFEKSVVDHVRYVDYMDTFGDEDELGQADIMWSVTAHLRNLVSDLTPEAAPFARDLEEVAAAWPSLTDERRRLVRAFVADQTVLSQLDRMPAPPGRYQIAIDLLERASDA